MDILSSDYPAHSFGNDHLAHLVEAQEIKNEEELGDALEMIEGNEKKTTRYRVWRLGKHTAKETSLPMTNIDWERFNGES